MDEEARRAESGQREVARLAFYDGRRGEHGKPLRSMIDWGNEINAPAVGAPMSEVVRVWRFRGRISAAGSRR
jgi:hypothetical protein